MNQWHELIEYQLQLLGASICLDLTFFFLSVCVRVYFCVLFVCLCARVQLQSVDVFRWIYLIYSLDRDCNAGEIGERRSGSGSSPICMRFVCC